MTYIKLSDTEIQKKIEELLKDKATMKRLTQKAIAEATEILRRRIKRAEKIDRIIEMVIPRRYSGFARDRMKSRVRKSLRNNHKI